MKRILLIIAIVLVLAAGAAVASLWSPYLATNEAFVELPRGTGTSAIARQLTDTGVVRYQWQVLLARALKPGLRLQAGEYRFAQPATVWQVLDRLRRGDVYLVELRVPEGFNLYDIATLVEQTKLASAADFIREASNPATIRDLAPDAPSLEGFLFPSTYHVPRRVTAAALCRMMTDLFRKEWKALQPTEPVLATVTLASLVEKETGVAEERPTVAGVYRNRLQQGMKLEADPTTIYAALLTGTWRGTIYRSDLQREHPYNTYAVAGLPPGPIANPGMASLRAALHPQANDFIYFVARPDGSGRHSFSRTYAEHSHAVQEYRRGRQGAGL